MPGLANKSKSDAISNPLGNRSALLSQTLKQLSYINVVPTVGGYQT
jgi:hypothetical protein